MRLNFCRLFQATLLSGALITTLAPLTLQAQPHSFHDAAHNDDHPWNGNEDKAYRMWAKQNHRKYVEFAKLKEEDQASYWAWRHQHSDADLKIVIK